MRVMHWSSSRDFGRVLHFTSITHALSCVLSHVTPAVCLFCTDILVNNFSDRWHAPEQKIRKAMLVIREINY